MPTDVHFRTQRRVEFSDTDMAGIMHFARFFHYMEQVEHEFLRSRSLSVITDWEGQKLGFPRVSAQCDYQAPIRFEEVMDVDLTLEAIGTKSLTYRFEFSKDKVKLATGKLVTCCCTMDKKHQMISIAIPDTLKARLLGKS